MAATFLDSLITTGTIMVITSCAFLLGVLFSNWPYNHYLLWDVSPDQESLTKLALNHYVHWLEVPKFIPYTMYGVVGVGFFGFIFKVFKPADDLKYMEYGSFGVYVLAICCYISNVRYGIYSAQAEAWGDYDEFTSLAVVAASEVMLVFLILGIVVVQSGIFFAKYEDDRVKHEFLMNELQLKLAQADKKIAEASSGSTATSATTSGSSKAETASSTKGKKK